MIVVELNLSILSILSMGYVNDQLNDNNGCRVVELVSCRSIVVVVVTFCVVVVVVVGERVGLMSSQKA